MNPYKRIPFTARVILEKEFESRMFLHRRLADEADSQGRFDAFQDNDSSAKFYAAELARVKDSLS